jgi:hypothetical protein
MTLPYSSAQDRSPRSIANSIVDPHDPNLAKCHLAKINCLVNIYLDRTHLTDLLTDLSQQFIHPQPRRWALIDWDRININQIVNIEPELFLAILQGAIDTEAPIRDYTQTSRQYLAPIHPLMAKFMGGTVDEQGNIDTIGLWQREECRHTPALINIYQQLKGKKIQPTRHQARPYQPSDSPQRDLYRHGLHRLLTEYGATCLYLWLMGHSTGTLQQALSELCIDEVNHLAKFWGFGVWLYPQPSGYRFIHNCRQLLPHQSQGNLFKTYHRMMSVLHWPEWNWQQRGLLIYTFYLVLRRLLAWHHSLKPAELNQLFGNSPISATK